MCRDAANNKRLNGIHSNAYLYTMRIVFTAFILMAFTAAAQQKNWYRAGDTLAPVPVTADTLFTPAMPFEWWDSIPAGAYINDTVTNPFVLLLEVKYNSYIAIQSGDGWQAIQLDYNFLVNNSRYLSSVQVDGKGQPEMVFHISGYNARSNYESSFYDGEESVLILNVDKAEIILNLPVKHVYWYSDNIFNERDDTTDIPIEELEIVGTDGEYAAQQYSVVPSGGELDIVAHPLVTTDNREQPIVLPAPAVTYVYTKSGHYVRKKQADRKRR